MELKSQKQVEFIEKFNELHKLLQRELISDFKKTEKGRKKLSDSKNSGEVTMTFEDCLYTIKKSKHYNYFKGFYDQFYLIKNLRNVLVHDSTEKFYDIAEPSDLSMEIMDRLSAYFLNPIKIRTFLVDHDVSQPLSFSPEDNLQDVLNQISEHQYSQFPIFKDNKLMGMLTDNGLTNLIANESDNDGLIFSDYLVESIISKDNYDENKDSYAVIYKESELYRVIDLFSVIERQIKYILITDLANNKISQKSDLIGILTTADIPMIMKKLNTKN